MPCAKSSLAGETSRPSRWKFLRRSKHPTGDSRFDSRRAALFLEPGLPGTLFHLEETRRQLKSRFPN